MAAIQSTAQRRSVRYSTEASMKSGTSAQRATARKAAWVEKSFLAMTQARPSTRAASGSIRRRARKTMSGRSPMARRAGAMSMLKRGE